MKIDNLIKMLQQMKNQYGNIDVLIGETDPGGPWSISSIELRVAEKDEFPKSFRMPEGFKFIELRI